MPYIQDQKRRSQMDEILELMVKHKVNADGDLNYLLFKYFKNHFDKRYNIMKNYCGELTECAGQIREEFLYPYERLKKKENGDV